MDIKELKKKCLENIKYYEEMEKINKVSKSTIAEYYNKGQKDAWARMGALLAIYFKGELCEETKESEKEPCSCTEQSATSLKNSDGGLQKDLKGRRCFQKEDITGPQQDVYK